METKYKILLFILFITTQCSFSQSQFKYDVSGINPRYFVIQSDSTPADSLFIHTINWIKKTYKNPSSVIKAQIENEMVRIEGYAAIAFLTKTLGMKNYYSGLYTVEFHFKKGKVKFEPIGLTYRVPVSQYTSGGMYDFPLFDGSAYYDGDGEIKSMFKLVPENTALIFNDVFLDFQNYIINKPSIDKEDW